MIQSPASVDDQTHLTPPLPEVLISLIAGLHGLLVITVLVLVFTRRARLPFGLLGIIVLFVIPVLGPVLVLNWNRLERQHLHAAR